MDKDSNPSSLSSSSLPLFRRRGNFSSSRPAASAPLSAALPEGPENSEDPDIRPEEAIIIQQIRQKSRAPRSSHRVSAGPKAQTPDEAVDGAMKKYVDENLKRLTGKNEETNKQEKETKQPPESLAALLSALPPSIAAAVLPHRPVDDHIDLAARWLQGLSEVELGEEEKQKNQQRTLAAIENSHVSAPTSKRSGPFSDFRAVENFLKKQKL